jgi:hypothetical protein
MSAERFGDFWPTNCSRCHADLNKTASTMSVFNTDVICLNCKTDEQQAPGYEAAADSEREACRHGHYNHPGVGLSELDKLFLAAKLATRKGVVQ